MLFCKGRALFASSAVRLESESIFANDLKENMGRGSETKDHHNTKKAWLMHWQTNGQTKRNLESRARNEKKTNLLVCVRVRDGQMPSVKKSAEWAVIVVLYF